jgi:hypothetical protein
MITTYVLFHSIKPLMAPWLGLLVGAVIWTIWLLALFRNRIGHLRLAFPQAALAPKRG